MSQMCSLLVAEMQGKFLGTLTRKSSDGASGYLPQLEAFQDTSQQEVLRNV